MRHLYNSYFSNKRSNYFRIQFCKYSNLSALLIASVLLCAPLHSQAFVSNFSTLFAEVDAKGNSGKNDAAARAQAKHGGKVLSVSESKSNGQIVYKVKLLLDSGRIKIVTIKG